MLPKMPAGRSEQSSAAVGESFCSLTTETRPSRVHAKLARAKFFAARRKVLLASMRRKNQAEDDLQWLRVVWLSRAPGGRFRLGGGEPLWACPDPSCGRL